VIGGGLSLALTPVPLALAAATLYGLPSTSKRVAQTVGALAVIATGVLLAVNAPLAAGSGVGAVYTTPLGGIGLVIRADRPGIALGLAATGIALLLVLERRRTPAETAALIVCLAGGVFASLAGNAVVLFGGLEIGNVGTLLLLSAGRRRPGRGALAALAVEHIAALGLLAAAVQLQGSFGTIDFTALPAGAIGAAVGIPWAVAGAVRLLTPALLPLRGAVGSATSWLGAGAVPAGAAVLIRLRDAAGGPLPDRVTLVLAGIGAAAAVAGGVQALRRSAAPPVAGRSLIVVTAGAAVAVSGFTGSAAAAATAAGICALLLSVALSELWERAAGTTLARRAGAAALVIAGGLPIGFGTTALVLEVGAALSLGRAAIALFAALGVGALLAAAASVRAASVVSVAPPISGSTPFPLLGSAALLASVFSAIAPGVVATSLMAALGGDPGRFGFAALFGPGGGWASGYLVVGLLVVAAAGWAIAELLGVRVPSAAPQAPTPAVPWPVRARRVRALRSPLRDAQKAVAAIDAWLTVQPQLPLVILGALLAILLIH
jgi:hypothetical protein